MRYLQTVVAGLVGGIVLTIVVVVAHGTLALIWLEVGATTCGENQCYGAVQFGSVPEVLTTFVIGFSAAFVWFLRRRGRLVGPSNA